MFLIHFAFTQKTTTTTSLLSQNTFSHMFEKVPFQLISGHSNESVTLIILMDYPIHIETIRIEQSILNLKWLSVNISLKIS